jgi:hypothetical protein
MSAEQKGDDPVTAFLGGLTLMFFLFLIVGGIIALLS